MAQAKKIEKFHPVLLILLPFTILFMGIWCGHEIYRGKANPDGRKPLEIVAHVLDLERRKLLARSDRKKLDEARVFDSEKLDMEKAKEVLEVVKCRRRRLGFSEDEPEPEKPTREKYPDPGKFHQAVLDYEHFHNLWRLNQKYRGEYVFSRHVRFDVQNPEEILAKANMYKYWSNTHSYMHIGLENHVIDVLWKRQVLSEKTKGQFDWLMVEFEDFKQRTPEPDEPEKDDEKEKKPKKDKADGEEEELIDYVEMYLKRREREKYELFKKNPKKYWFGEYIREHLLSAPLECVRDYNNQCFRQWESNLECLMLKPVADEMTRVNRRLKDDPDKNQEFEFYVCFRNDWNQGVLNGASAAGCDVSQRLPALTREGSSFHGAGLAFDLTAWGFAKIKLWDAGFDIGFVPNDHVHGSCGENGKFEDFDCELFKQTWGERWRDRGDIWRTGKEVLKLRK